MREFFENMVSQEKKVRMMQEEYHRIKQSLDICLLYTSDAADD